MPNCIFEEKNGECICITCGYKIRAADCGRAHKRCGEEDYPSLLEMTGNFLKEGARCVKTGFYFSNEEEEKRRIDICNQCDRYDKEKNRCKECGCYLAWKTSLAGGACPLSKW